MKTAATALAAALAAALVCAAAHGADFYCSNTSRVQITQLDDGFETAAVTGHHKNRGPYKSKVDRFDVMQAYSGQPVLVGATWLTACMLDPAHPDTRNAFGGLIGINPESAATMARSSGLVDRGIRITRSMSMCLAENAPAVGYSAIPITATGVKPCF
jgi:hypothetical protein